MKNTRRSQAVSTDTAPVRGTSVVAPTTVPHPADVRARARRNAAALFALADAADDRFRF